MLLTYADESYDRQRYWMVALAIAEHHVRPLQRALDSVVRKAAESYPVDESAELHGHALLQAREDWAAMRTKEGDMVRARIGVYGDALKAIGAHDVQIIIRGLDLERYPSRAELPVPPHQRVLKDLLSRVNDQARTYGQWTLIIADEIDGAAEHQQHFRLYQRDGIDGIGATGSRRSSTRSASPRPAQAAFSRLQTSSPTYTAGSPLARIPVRGRGRRVSDCGHT
ncbi:hypothetical protein [Streptomyces clavifer]|uniref:hypothetical protein n=1 Tax=Streptomyces clavifer TaxID=68188 RepID=UPI0033FC793B